MADAVTVRSNKIKLHLKQQLYHLFQGKEFLFFQLSSTDKCCTIREQNIDYFLNSIYRMAFVIKQKIFLHELSIQTETIAVTKATPCLIESKRAAIHT